MASTPKTASLAVVDQQPARSESPSTQGGHPSEYAASTSPTTPSSVQPVQSSSAATPTPTKPAKPVSRPAVPAVPIMPAIPKVGPQGVAKPRPAAETMAPGEGASPLDQSALSDAKTASSRTLSAGDSPVKAEDAAQEESSQPEQKSAAPPVQPGPPKTWAKLFTKPTPSAGGSKAQPAPATANGLAATDGQTGSAPPGPTGFSKSNTSSMAEALRAYRVGNAETKFSFIEPRGLINTGNMCYMNSVCGLRRRKLAHCLDSPSLSLSLPFNLVSLTTISLPRCCKSLFSASPFMTSWIRPAKRPPTVSKAKPL